MKLAIGIADNHHTLYKEFAMSLVGLTSFFHQWAQGRHTLDVLNGYAGNIADMRNCIAEDVVEGGYDYVLWLDSDQTFPVDIVPRMLAYCVKEGYEAISGLYTYKTAPFMPHIYPRLDEATGKFGVPTSFPLDKPCFIEGAGFGCLMMSVKVFERLQKPYFSMEYEHGRMVLGEDLTFCRAARMKMILDPTIRSGHIRATQFGIADYVRYNGIEVVDGWVKPTQQQMDKVMKDMSALFAPKSVDDSA